MCHLGILIDCHATWFKKACCCKPETIIITQQNHRVHLCSILHSHPSSQTKRTNTNHLTIPIEHAFCLSFIHCTIHHIHETQKQHQTTVVAAQFIQPFTKPTFTPLCWLCVFALRIHTCADSTHQHVMNSAKASTKPNQRTFTSQSSFHSFCSFCNVCLLCKCAKRIISVSALLFSCSHQV